MVTTQAASRDAHPPIALARASLVRALWAAWVVFVPLVLIAAVGVEAVPRARGIGFFMELRYAVMTPLCALLAVGSALFYRVLMTQAQRPQRVLGVALGGFGAVMLLLLLLLGRKGLAAAAAPAMVLIAAALGLLIPRFIERPPRRVGTIATMLLGVLELAGVAAALRSERLAPPGPEGMAFEIPRTMLDADHKFIDLPSGARIHYVDVGSGPTLLFLHGNPAWSFQWRDLIGGLRGSFRCVALDYPGFGLSSAPEGYGFTPREQSHVVEEFVEKLGLHDVTLVMQDWGGPIGLGFAGRRPELVRALVLGNTWAWPTTTREARGKFSKIAGGPLGEFVQMNFNGFAGAALKQGVTRQLPEDVAEVYARPFGRMPQRGVAAFYPAQITDAADYFAEVEAGLARLHDRPALIFWGMRDPGFPRADLERFERAFPDHQTTELPEANHFFFEDAAPQMVEQVKTFEATRAGMRSGAR